jgi:hypothetical protein
MNILLVAVSAAGLVLNMVGAQAAEYELYNGDPYYFQNTFWIDPGPKSYPEESHFTPREFEDIAVSAPSASSTLKITMFNQAYYSLYDEFNDLFEVATQGFLHMTVNLWKDDRLVRSVDWVRPDERNVPGEESKGFDSVTLEFNDPHPETGVYRYQILGVTGNVGGQYQIEYWRSNDTGSRDCDRGGRRGGDDSRSKRRSRSGQRH